MFRRLTDERSNSIINRPKYRNNDQRYNQVAHGWGFVGGGGQVAHALVGFMVQHGEGGVGQVVHGSGGFRCFMIHPSLHEQNNRH